MGVQSHSLLGTLMLKWTVDEHAYETKHIDSLLSINLAIHLWCATSHCAQSRLSHVADSIGIQYGSLRKVQRSLRLHRLRDDNRMKNLIWEIYAAMPRTFVEGSASCYLV